MNIIDIFFMPLVYFSAIMFVISVLFVWQNKEVDITIYSHMMFITFICAPIFCIIDEYIKGFIYTHIILKSWDPYVFYEFYDTYMLFEFFTIFSFLLYGFLCSLYLKKILKSKYNSTSVKARCVFVTLLTSFYYLPYFISFIFFVVNK